MVVTFSAIGIRSIYASRFMSLNVEEARELCPYSCIRAGSRRGRTSECEGRGARGLNMGVSKKERTFLLVIFLISPFSVPL